MCYGFFPKSKSVFLPYPNAEINKILTCFSAFVFLQARNIVKAIAAKDY